MKFARRMTREEFFCRLSAVLAARRAAANVRVGIYTLLVVLSIISLVVDGLNLGVVMLLVWSSLLVLLDVTLAVAAAVDDDNFEFEEVAPDER